MAISVLRPGLGKNGLAAIFFNLAMLICVFEWTASFSFAQQITGSITGSIKDSQGATVNNATVHATNVETGFSRSTHAKDDGTYLIQFLPVGHYSLEANAPGFKKFVQENIVVTVDTTSTVDMSFSIGSELESITVTTAPPMVQTTTSEIGTTFLRGEIENLPLLNHNAYAELSLTPGVMSNSADPTTNPNGQPNFIVGQPSTQVQINGSTDGGVPTVSFYLDGGLNMSSLRNYGNSVPNPSALEEFRVETNNFSAQYGRASGGVITVVTRSGTNQFHGSLFEFHRETAFNDTNWNSITKAPFHRNQFGGGLGGPIRHNKAFFFFSYAGLRQVVGQNLTGGTVPSAAERLGDFTADTVKVYAPGTKTQVKGTNAGPGCGTPTLNCIPAALLDRAAANLMSKYIPLPNTGKQYRGVFAAPTNQNEYLGKYDEVFSDKDHFAVGYFYQKTLQDVFGGGNFSWQTTESISTQQNVNLSEIHTLSQNMVNQAWVTFSRVAGGRTNLPTGVGLDDLGSSFTTQGIKTLPQLNVSGYFNVGGASAGPVTTTDFYSVRDMITINAGRHSLFFGGEQSLDKLMTVGNLINFGSFTFATSAPTTTGNALSDFVTGQVATMEQDSPTSLLISHWYTGVFLQDNYRILPNLTLNLGLRWDLQTSPVESRDRTATFRPDVQSTVVPGAPKGMLFPGDSGVPRGIAPNRYHHISPRVGVAWDPLGDGKMAVRAAAGIFYGNVSGNEWNQPSNALPFSVRQTFNSIASLTNVYGNQASFPNGNPFPYIFDPKNPRFLPAAAIETIANDYQWPLAYQINAAVQQQLPNNIVLTTAYVGTLSHHLPFMIDANYAPYAPGANTSQASINARRPYNPGVLGQVGYIESNETASYHSLQVVASKPFTHNFSLNGFYIWSHAFQSVNNAAVGLGSAQDFANLWEERSPMSSDIRHNAVIRGNWRTDYYDGNHRFLKQVLNGWTISPILRLRSGTPFTVTTGSNNNFDSANASRPNLVPGVSPFLDPHRPRDVAAKQWINKAAFTPNGPGLGIGIGGADGNSPRNYFRSPGFRSIDMGLFRDFLFQRGIVFQLRAEANNAFNMVSLGTPTTTLSSPSFGQITTASPARLLQVGGRLTF